MTLHLSTAHTDRLCRHEIHFIVRVTVWYLLPVICYQRIGPFFKCVYFQIKLCLLRCKGILLSSCII